MRIKQLEFDAVIPRWDAFNPNFFYLIGRDIDHAVAYIKDGDFEIYTTKLNEAICKKMFGEDRVHVITKLSEIRNALQGRCKIDADYIPYAVCKRLKSKNMQLITNEIRTMREVKDAQEIKRIRKAKRIIESIVFGLENVRGMTERQVKRTLLVKIAENGVREAFNAIVANSSNARFPHYSGGNSTIRDYVLIDAGVKHKMYNSDITRCIGNMNSNCKKRYELLKHSVMEISDEAYAGRKIADFIECANKIIRKNSLHDFPHSIGHGIGLEVHEYPSLNSRSQNALRKNAVITIEPGQYDKKGMRYENMFIIKNNGAKLL